MYSCTKFVHHTNKKYSDFFIWNLFQNWRRAHKKRVLFKLGSTLVGEIDVIEERNNNSDVTKQDDDVILSDNEDNDNEEPDVNPTASTSSSPTHSNSSSDADNSRVSVYDEILHDED